MFVYYTGHGGEDSIDTRDGHLQLDDIIKPFSQNESLAKIFILDTCSSLSNLYSILPHSILLFPAHPGYPAFAKPDDCGLLTKHLAPALRTSSKSFGDIVVDVTDAITQEINLVSSESQLPLLFQTLKSHVCLLQKERKQVCCFVYISLLTLVYSYT